MGCFKTSFIAILIFILTSLLIYQWIIPDNGTYKYRDEDGGLLSWVGPYKSCIIDTYDTEGLGKTPILGVDKNGRNFAYSISVALWTNLWLALSSAVIFFFSATLLGVVIGYNQQSQLKRTSLNSLGLRRVLKNVNSIKLIQSIARGFVQALHAIPLLLLLLIIVVVANRLFENDLIRMFIIMVALGVLSSPKLALLIKDRIKMLEDEEFIDATKASGLSDVNIIIKHILWYDCSPIIAGQVVYIIVQAIMLEVVISFLGYGIRIDHTSIGGLITQYKDDLPGSNLGNPLALLPLIVLLVIALVGNRLTDLFMDLRRE